MMWQNFLVHYQSEKNGRTKKKSFQHNAENKQTVYQEVLSFAKKQYWWRIDHITQVVITRQEQHEPNSAHNLQLPR